MSTVMQGVIEKLLSAKRDLRNAANKLNFIERRSMEQHFMLHEVVRQFGNELDEWIWHLDETYFNRKVWGSGIEMQRRTSFLIFCRACSFFFHLIRMRDELVMYQLISHSYQVKKERANTTKNQKLVRRCIPKPDPPPR